MATGKSLTACVTRIPVIFAKHGLFSGSQAFLVDASVCRVYSCTILKLFLFIAMLIASAVSYAANEAYYYQWNKNLFTSGESACQTSLDYINRSEGNSYVIEDVVTNVCPPFGPNMQCGSCKVFDEDDGDNDVFALHMHKEAFGLPMPNEKNSSAPVTTSNSAECSMVGNPVNPVTGAKQEVVGIVKTSGLYPIEISLIYDSMAPVKWAHSYNRIRSINHVPVDHRYKFDIASLPQYKEMRYFPAVLDYDPQNPLADLEVKGTPYTIGDTADILWRDTPDKACEDGWDGVKQGYQLDWIDGSYARYARQPVDVSLPDSNYCFIYDGNDQYRMALNIYGLYSGEPTGYPSGVDEESFVRFHRPDGDVIVFSVYDEIKNITGTGERLSVTVSGSDTLYSLHNRNDETEKYNKYGRVEQIISPQGHVQTLTYDPATYELLGISNETGDAVSFQYEPNGSGHVRIKSITDVRTSRIWQLLYDSLTGNLQRIIKPDASNIVFAYQYGPDTSLLTGINDENGFDYARWEYDSQGRAIASGHGTWGDIDRVEIDYQQYGDRTVTRKRKGADKLALNNPDSVADESFVSTYKTHPLGSFSLVSEITGHAPVSYKSNAESGYLEEINDHNLVTRYSGHDEAGNPAEIIEAAGTVNQRSTSIEYDSRYVSKPSIITVPSVLAGKQKKVTISYDNHGNVEEHKISGYRLDGSRVNRTVAYKYEGPHKQVTEIDGPLPGDQDLYRFSYYDDIANVGTSRARLKTVTGPEGLVLYDNIKYSRTGAVRKYDDVNGMKVLMTFYPGSFYLHTVSQTNPVTGETRLTAFSYLNSGEIREVTTGVDEADKTTIAFGYDQGRRLTSITDGLGNSIKYHLDSDGNVEKESIHDAAGSLVKQLMRTFDEYNRQHLQLQANESRTENWLPEGVLNSTIDGNNVRTSYGYDELRRLTRIEMDKGGNSQQTADALIELDYDVQDNLTMVKDAVNGETRYFYNDLGDLERLQSPDSGITEFGHDAAGNVISSIDANGNAIFYSYDGLSRLLAIDAPGQDDDYQFKYDDCVYGKGRLCKVTGRNNTVFYEYDAFGNVSSQQNLQYAYDTANRIQSITYPSSAVVTYYYDAAGQVSRVELFRNGKLEVLASNVSYQAFGDVSSLDYGNNLSLSQARDLAYRPLSQHVSGVLGPGVLGLNYTMYDENGNLTVRADGITGLNTTFGYDAHDRLVAANGEFGSRAYEYDKNANRMLLNEDGAITHYDYDASTDPLNAPHQPNRMTMRGVDGVALDDNGNTLSIGERRYTYTTHNRLFEVYDNGTHKATYQYNGLGQRVSKQVHSDSGAGTGTGIGKYFVYDTDGKLMAEFDQGGTVLLEYIYLNGQLLAVYSPDTDVDGVNNMQEARAGTNPDVIDRDNDGLADIIEKIKTGTSTASNDSDSDGLSDKQEHDLQSDPLDASVTIGDVNLDGSFGLGDYLLLARYVLDPSIPNATEFVQADVNADGYLNVQDMVIMQNALLDLTANVNSFSLEHLWASITDSLLPVALAANGDGDIYYVHNDHLGTPIKMTDETGVLVWSAIHDPFGKASINDDVDGDGIHVTLNVRFPGQYYDEESGLHYNYFRTYDPELGRYLTSDPIGLAGGVNTFGYVGGDPIRNIDPQGLFRFGITRLDIAPIPIPLGGNLDLWHVQGFFEDGSNIGFGPNGWMTNENPGNYYFFDQKQYNDYFMRKALNTLLKSNEWSPVPGHNKIFDFGISDYDLIGHNCQDFQEALIQEYNNQIMIHQFIQGGG